MLVRAYLRASTSEQDATRARDQLRAFVADVQASWEKHGAEVLERVAREEPGTYLRIIAGLMPKDVRLDVSVDPVGFAQNFRDAVRLLHEPGHVARPMKVINGS